MLVVMPEEIAKSYESLIDSYLESQKRGLSEGRGQNAMYDSARFIIDRVNAEIEAVNEEQSIYSEPFCLRPDAVLFLLLNFHQVVILPLQHAYGPNLEEYDSGGAQLSNILEGVAQDIHIIIEQCIEAARSKDRKDIPASIVLQQTSEVLYNLNLKNFRIWENIYVPAKA